jgi:ABC-type hemin transport system ATPase subunit
MLKIENLRASVDGKAILKGISLAIAPGEIQAIMGEKGPDLLFTLCPPIGTHSESQSWRPPHD